MQFGLMLLDILQLFIVPTGSVLQGGAGLERAVSLKEKERAFWFACIKPKASVEY